MAKGHTNLGGYGYEGKGGLNSSLSLLGTLLGERGDSPAAIWRDAERGKLRFPLRKNQKPSVFRRLLILWSGRREISPHKMLHCFAAIPLLALIRARTDDLVR